MKEYLIAISILASAFLTSAQINTTKEKTGSNSNPAGQFTADRFEIIEYPNAIRTIASAINKRGEIVGQIEMAGGKVVGFVFRKKEFELIEVPGAEFTMARGINDHGHIVGATRRAGGRNTGYILKDKAFTSLTFPGAEKTGPFQINSHGDVVGSYSRDGRQHGFLRRRTGEFLSLEYPGAILTYATGINDRGEIVGRWDSSDGREHGFHWRDGEFKILDVPDAAQTLPDAINNRSDVVGRAIMVDGSVLGFYRRDGVFQTFSYPGARRTVARGINDKGDIVGPFEMPDGKRGGFVLHAKQRKRYSHALGLKTGRVEVDGLPFSYIEQGSGEPVVLIHGSMWDYRAWSKQIKPLARKYRVVAYSRRYHWPNPLPNSEKDASTERQVNDLAEIIKALKLGPAHLVGHSFGGAVAVQLALKHPELVRTLVLLEPGVASVLGDTSARNEGPTLRSRMMEAFASGDANRINSTYAATVAPGRFEKARPEVRQMLSDNVAAFQLDYTSRRLPFTCDTAKQITIPVLVLSGELSAPGLQHISKVAAGCLKNAKSVSIPNATHWIPHDQPKRLNEVLLGFLARKELERMK